MALPPIELSQVAAADNAGHSVASAGDLNGDGFADLLVGAAGAEAGRSYVIPSRNITGSVSHPGTSIAEP